MTNLDTPITEMFDNLLVEIDQHIQICGNANDLKNITNLLKLKTTILLNLIPNDK